MKSLKYVTRLFLFGLMSSVAQVVCFAQEGGHVAKTSEKIAQLQAEDPHGFVLTITAVLVVFTALVMLATVFTLVGKAMHNFATRDKSAKPKKKAKKQKSKAKAGQAPAEASVAISMALTQELRTRNDEVMVAISMALHSEMECQHDEESYALTIVPRPTQWNARSLSMRQYNY